MKVKIFQEKQINILLVLGFVFLLNSCGFQLKGSNAIADYSSATNQPLSNLNIKVSGASSSYIAPKLKKLVGKNQKNEKLIYRINLTNEVLETKIISYNKKSDPNGYEVRLSLTYVLSQYQDGVKKQLYSEKLENFDYLFTNNGDSLSEINREKMKVTINTLASNLAEKIYSGALNQLNSNKKSQK